MVHRSRQGRAHEPIREFRTAETQSLSHLVPTDPGRVQGCWCPSWTTRTDLPIETIRTFQSRHLVTTSLAFADRQRDEAEDNSIAYIHYALIHGITTDSTFTAPSSRFRAQHDSNSDIVIREQPRWSGMQTCVQLNNYEHWRSYPSITRRVDSSHAPLRL